MVYLPPPLNLNIVNNYFDKASEVVENINNVIILGDFNMGFIEWSRLQSNQLSPCNYQNNFGYRLVDFMSQSGLRQINDVLNVSGKTLDLALTNMDNLNLCLSYHTLSKKDVLHPPLEIHIDKANCSSSRNVTVTGFNFYKACYDDINNYLHNIDWYEHFENAENNVNKMVEMFYNVIFESFRLFIPVKKCKHNLKPSWFDKELTRMSNEKRKLRLRYRRYGNPRDKFEFGLIRARFKKMLNDKYANYISNTETNIKNNPKYFWNYVKSKRGLSNTLPCQMSNDTETATSDFDIANLFAKQFSSVYKTKLTSSQLPHSSQMVDSTIPLHRIVFTEREILKIIKSLDTTKGTGPDNIPLLFIKRCCNNLVCPLTLIFNTSIKTGIFPEERELYQYLKKAMLVTLKTIVPFLFSHLFRKYLNP